MTITMKRICRYINLLVHYGTVMIMTIFSIIIMVCWWKKETSDHICLTQPSNCFINQYSNNHTYFLFLNGILKIIPLSFFSPFRRFTGKLDLNFLCLKSYLLYPLISYICVILRPFLLYDHHHHKNEKLINYNRKK